jgi:hypothetical protein
MSTLTVQTISNGTVSTSSANVIQGSAKAWVNFNGTGTVAIRASYNVSSITDNGTGDYTVNFTNAMANANYGICFGGSYDNAGSANQVYFTTYNLATSSVRIQTRGQFGGLSGGALNDTTTVSISVFS